VDIVRRAFPTLRDVLENKIDFAISPRKDMYGGPLISILDDAWAGMATWPPETMLVSVKEFPEDKARRECHTDPKDNEERPLTLIILSSRAQARKRMDHALEDHRLDRVGVCRYRPLGGAAQKSTVVYCRTELRHRARTTGDNTGRYSSIRRSPRSREMRSAWPSGASRHRTGLTEAIRLCYEMPRMYNCADDTPSGSANIGEANRDRMRRRYGRDCAIV
jgi:hypothetical protein